MDVVIVRGLEQLYNEDLSWSTWQIPTLKTSFANDGLMLGQRRRRLPNIKPVLTEYIVLG